MSDELCDETPLRQMHRYEILVAHFEEIGKDGWK